MRTQGEDGRIHAEERGRRRSPSCGHLDPSLPASRTVRKYISAVEAPVWGAELRRPQDTDPGPTPEHVLQRFHLQVRLCPTHTCQEGAAHRQLAPRPRRSPQRPVTGTPHHTLCHVIFASVVLWPLSSQRRHAPRRQGRIFTLLTWFQVGRGLLSRCFFKGMMISVHCFCHTDQSSLQEGIEFL